MSNAYISTPFCCKDSSHCYNLVICQILDCRTCPYYFSLLLLFVCSFNKTDHTQWELNPNTQYSCFQQIKYIAFGVLPCTIYMQIILYIAFEIMCSGRTREWRGSRGSAKRWGNDQSRWAIAKVWLSLGQFLMPRPLESWWWFWLWQMWIFCNHSLNILNFKYIICHYLALSTNWLVALGLQVFPDTTVSSIFDWYKPQITRCFYLLCHVYSRATAIQQKYC